jgi:hypothetical protein
MHFVYGLPIEKAVTDPNTLIAWMADDPPDALEIARKGGPEKPGTITAMTDLAAAYGADGSARKAVATPATPPADPTQDPRYRLNVNVELVNVTATVLDDQGKYLDGLKLDDFQVYEDGQEQKISFFSHDLRVPISVGVLIDSARCGRFGGVFHDFSSRKSIS